MTIPHVDSDTYKHANLYIRSCISLKTVTAYAYSLTGFWFARFASLVICRLCMDVHGSVQRVHLAELYPSGLRSLIAGFVYTCANLAGLLSPFIDYLASIFF